MRPTHIPLLVPLLMGPPLMAAADVPALVTGKALFEENCVACHGKDARGGTGGDIRDAIVRQLRMATGGGFENMPEFELTDEEIEALAAYLNSLL